MQRLCTQRRRQRAAERASKAGTVNDSTQTAGWCCCYWTLGGMAWRWRQTETQTSQAGRSLQVPEAKVPPLTFLNLLCNTSSRVNSALTTTTYINHSTTHTTPTPTPRTEQTVLSSRNNSKLATSSNNHQPQSSCLLSDLRNFLPAPARLPAVLCLLCPSEAKRLDNINDGRQLATPTYYASYSNMAPGLTGSSMCDNFHSPSVTQSFRRGSPGSFTAALFAMARVRICTCNSNTTPTRFSTCT
ncbi:hypothetical protein FALBO_586 [Fusarium albosuccineum]|uniref:Uncharacterized protein n=1 Tax=Fusarium albosuccineum TaxID=1237068 RepID=A0A8H4PI72_9HYPO|nr:hypothetical protein FALBO_586 [Fusarium albosuccineum]